MEGIKEAIAFITGLAVKAEDPKTVEINGKTYCTTMRTREEMEAEIRGLQQLLAATDYKALKHADGALTDEEYEPTRTQRAEYRQQINDLQAAIETLETTEGQVVDNE